VPVELKGQVTPLKNIIGTSPLTEKRMTIGQSTRGFFVTLTPPIKRFVLSQLSFFNSHLQKNVPQETCFLNLS